MKLKKIMLLPLFLLALACSKDDDGGGRSDLEGVPSGEIVAEELRNITLTGFDETRMQSGQKWWTLDVIDFSFSGNCGDEEDFQEDGIAYVAFSNDGQILQRSSPDGSEFQTGDWNWESGKNSIFVSNNTGEGSFTITYLNDNNVVYANSQSIDGCTLTSYTKLIDPFTD